MQAAKTQPEQLSVSIRLGMSIWQATLSAAIQKAVDGKR